MKSTVYADALAIENRQEAAHPISSLLKKRDATGDITVTLSGADLDLLIHAISVKIFDLMDDRHETRLQAEASGIWTAEELAHYFRQIDAEMATWGHIKKKLLTAIGAEDYILGGGKCIYKR